MKDSQISESYISWIYEFQLLSLTLALVHNAQNYDGSIDYLRKSLTAGEVHCLKSQGWNTRMRISHCTLKCKHGTYDSLLQHLCVFCTILSSVSFISRYVTFSPFFSLPPSVLHKNPHNPHQLLSVGLCHILFPFLLSYLKCFPLQLFFSVYLVLFLSTCPLLLYVPSLFFKLNVSFHGVAPESRWRVRLLTVLEVKTRPLCGLIMGQTGWRRVKGTHVHTRMQTHVVALFKLVWRR